MVTVQTGRERSLQGLEAPLYGRRAPPLHLRPVTAHASACGLFCVLHAPAVPLAVLHS